jgi:hypothetical protein
MVSRTTGGSTDRAARVQVCHNRSDSVRIAGGGTHALHGAGRRGRLIDELSQAQRPGEPEESTQVVDESEGRPVRA